ncbi:Speckle targeted PIP5K1A-regulated poly(A) polymerase, partial [Coemansia sp. RSA 1290]
MLNSRFRMHFLPPLDQLEALQMPPNADRHEGLDMELEYLSQLWNAGQSEEVQKNIIGTIVAVGKHLDNRVLFKVDIHGSRLYGLCKSNSDFDIIANVRVPRGALEDSVFMGFIKRFTARLQAQRGFSRVIWLKRARVPIIKFHYRTQSGEYEGDISFNNGIGQSKAQLIMRYMEADPRVRLFLILVKNWGVERMICDSNVMNSFGLLMMALTFLIQERVVPPLQLLSTFRATQKTWDNLHLLQASPEAISQL